MYINISTISQFTSPYRSKLIIEAYRPWVTKKEKILDIGCGRGITTKIIMENFKVDVIGCDIENYLVVNLPFYLIPKSGKLPFLNKSFDVALLNDVLHHVDKSVQFHILREALRIAKRVLIFEAEPTLPGKIFDMILNKLHYGSLDTPLTFQTSAGWRKVFEKMKLEYTIKIVKTPIWYPFSHIAMMIKR